jgi:hypothetical protein
MLLIESSITFPNTRSLRHVTTSTTVQLPPRTIPVPAFRNSGSRHFVGAHFFTANDIRLFGIQADFILHVVVASGKQLPVLHARLSSLLYSFSNFGVFF